MDQLRFTGLHEDGAHLVVTATDGTDFVVAADERLRAALRQSAVHSGPRTVAATPREVQTHIRAGLSAEEVAESTGWTVERVRLYEGPILAERAHVARLGSACAVRTHDRSGPAPTLEARVRDRLQARGVNTDHVTWDSKRPEGGTWSVQVQFTAGQRVRHASWSFDVASRSVEAIDDEARWLSEDEQTLPASAPAAAVFGAGMDGPDDLISSMRERSRRRGQTGGRRRKGAAPVSEPEGGSASPIEGDQELPLEDLPAAEVSTDSVRSSTELEDELQNDADHADVAVSDGAVELAQSADRDEVDGEDGGVEDGGVEDGGNEKDVDQDNIDDGHTSLEDFFGLSDGADTDDADTDEDDTDNDVGDDNTDTDTDDVDTDAHHATAEASTSAKPATRPKPTPPSSARKGRPSVPSWDDIMFGARDRKS